ncbi:MAG TPA: BamA/TamA family outer membrane protein [Flavitalea sp.]|nr:BamA/TamA family outer membrane protein [Flavitalea sp.]
MFLKRFFFLVPVCIFLVVSTGCNVTKNVPAGDALYRGASIKIEGAGLSKQKKKIVNAELRTLTRPRPNTRFLGIPFKLMLYNLAGKPDPKDDPKKEKGFRRWLRSLGEAPVLLSDVNLKNNADILRNHMENRGFFHASAEGDTSVKNRKAMANYFVKPGVEYTINDVIFPNDTTVLIQSILKTKAKSLLKKGEAYNLDIIKLERQRIDVFLKENGFYYFNADFLLLQVDSTIGNAKVDMYLRVKPETPDEAKSIYTINNVYIYPNYRLNTAAVDTNRAHSQLYRGYYVVDRRKLYNPRLFEQAMQFEKGDIYNRTDHNQTLNRLINLNIFKFVKNKFDDISNGSHGDAKLDAIYYLTPFPRKSIRAEIGGNTKSNNLTGSQVTFGFTNRNTFKGGEIFNLNANIGSEVQFSGQFKGYNTFRYGIDAKFSIPRFVTPFITLNTKSGYVPRTNIQLGYDVLTRQKLYTLNSFRGSFGYAWKESINKEYEFNPISIQYVQPINITARYRDSLLVNRTLQKAVDTQFILGSNFNYNFNQLLGNRPTNGFYFNGLIDLSGNVAGLVSGANVKKQDTVRLFQAQFSQYIKTEADFRYYRKIGLQNVWANRIIVGFGLPYGNSSELPFIKQFFIGGNNSLRAFRSRSVGPGHYVPVNMGSLGFFPDQSGDIKLEMNTEFRAKLNNVIEGAVFVDAGNIWLYNENPLKPGSQFTKDFLKELAIGTGVGVRFDLSILILRIDLGIPLKKAYLPLGEQWVLREVDPKSKEWRKNNMIFNLAIGYPF